MIGVIQVQNNLTITPAKAKIKYDKLVNWLGSVS